MTPHERFERHLRTLPPDAPPAGVYERLQGRAAWNRPTSGRPALPWLVAAVLAGVLAAALLAVLVTRPGTGDIPPSVEPSAPTSEPASVSPVVTPLPLPRPVIAIHADPDQVGGLSSLLLGPEPPFSVPFDTPDPSPSLDDLLMDS